MGLVTSLTAQHTTHTLAMPPKKKGAKDTQQRKRRGPPTAETIALRAKLKREAKQQAQSDARAAFVNSFRSSSSVQQPDSAFVADDGDDGHDVGDDDDDGGDDALAASGAEQPAVLSDAELEESASAGGAAGTSSQQAGDRGSPSAPERPLVLYVAAKTVQAEATGSFVQHMRHEFTEYRCSTD